MNIHLQQHLSIGQVTEALKIGRDEAFRLINLSKLRPSFALAYSNGDIQLLYDKHDIRNLESSSQTGKESEYKTTTKTDKNLLARPTE
ncbi:hypothetical protein D3C76_1237530 [compost metagenome]